MTMATATINRKTVLIITKSSSGIESVLFIWLKGLQVHFCECGSFHVEVRVSVKLQSIKKEAIDLSNIKNLTFNFFYKFFNIPMIYFKNSFDMYVCFLVNSCIYKSET